MSTAKISVSLLMHVATASRELLYNIFSPVNLGSIFGQPGINCNRIFSTFFISVNIQK